MILLGFHSFSIYNFAVLQTSGWSIIVALRFLNLFVRLIEKAHDPQPISKRCLFLLKSISFDKAFEGAYALLCIALVNPFLASLSLLSSGEPFSIILSKSFHDSSDSSVINIKSQ